MASNQLSVGSAILIIFLGIFLMVGIPGLAVYFDDDTIAAREERKEKRERQRIQQQKENALATYQQACEENDYLKAHEMLNVLRTDYQQNNQNPSGDEYRKYASADINIFQSELVFLMEQGGMENKIVSLILETPLDGSAPVEGFCDYETYMDENNYINLNNDCRNRLNQKCDLTLDYCILLGNKTLAAKILSIYKGNIVKVEGTDANGGIEVRGQKIRENQYYVYYNSASKDAAQKKFNDAVKNGAF